MYKLEDVHRREGCCADISININSKRMQRTNICWQAAFILKKKMIDKFGIACWKWEEIHCMQYGCSIMYMHADMLANSRCLNHKFNTGLCLCHKPHNDSCCIAMVTTNPTLLDVIECLDKLTRMPAGLWCYLIAGLTCCSSWHQWKWHSHCRTTSFYLDLAWC